MPFRSSALLGSIVAYLLVVLTALLPGGLVALLAGGLLRRQFDKRRKVEGGGFFRLPVRKVR